MQLREKRTAPPGGLYYICADGRRIDSPTDLRRLIISVENYYLANQEPIPPELSEMIEDQICARLPESFCWKGFGDHVATMIHAGADVVDKLFGTELKARAQGCSGCASRRRKLNKIS